MTFRLLLAVLITTIVSPHLVAQQTTSAYNIFLIGDAGEPFITGSPLGKILREKVIEAGPNSILLYLGDNVYPQGLPDKNSKHYTPGVLTLQTQVDWSKNLNVRGIFIPGNHDWDHWGKDGLSFMHNQQQWIDSLHDDHFTVLPRDGCPGPVEINLNTQTLLVIIDTQWLLHQFDKPEGADSPCDAKTTADVLTSLEDIFHRNPGKRIIVAGHHPVISYGEHGGVFKPKQHLFPLTEAVPWLYVPMPGVGSIYPLYRKWFGHIQDISNPLYKEFANGIAAIMAKYPGNFYVAGHEHALEYIVKDSTNFIVSGAGSKTEYVKKKSYALYAKAQTGFARLSVHEDGSVTTTFFHVDAAVPGGEVAFEKTVASLIKKPSFEGNSSIAPKTIKLVASKQYQAGQFKKLFFGENYRQEWAQEMEVPVFDIGAEKGGLKILQKGGGQQTLSLRFEDSTKHEYVVRSVEKFPEAALPPMLRKTFAQDVVQDQISASHPYGALVIASLADAAKIYHTNPKVMFIPNDPRFGQYQRDFANTLVLFEERPAGDWSDYPNFGNSKKIINTAKVLDKMAEDNDNKVDQEFVLRSRLFDMIIGDWDRHDDQWRWATFKDKKKEIYRPIPRDRDQAFFMNEGWLGKLWSRKWALPKFEGFDNHINWPSGLSFNARYFDRSFLNSLSEREWIAVAEDLKKSLTDESIENAIHQWPAAIVQIHGARIIKNLKRRRDDLVAYAQAHYKFLAKEVDIAASNKRELFIIEREADGDTELKIYKLNKDNEKGQKLFERRFHRHETKEIRLYGLGGDDEFRITGKSRKPIKVRIIGGDGKDRVIDSLKHNDSPSRILYYDIVDRSQLLPSGVRNKTSKDPTVNTFNRKAFQYNRLAPLLYGNYNFDDGIFLGGGFIDLTYGFRKQPYKQRHMMLASMAPATQSFNFAYKGIFTDVFGKLNLVLDADIKAPNYVNNFFGMGNESVFDRHINDQPGIQVDEPVHYYRYRFEEMKFQVMLNRKIGRYAFVEAGPSIQRIELEYPGNKDRFIKEYAATLSQNIFDGYNAFVGAQWKIGIDKRDHPTFTRRGAMLSISGRNMSGLNKGSHNFSSYNATLSFHHAFRQHSRLVFAVRTGAGTNTGNYVFYQAQILDGKTELRGFRKTRFYGDSKFYSNFEARLRLMSFRSYLFPASMGVLGFYDIGRVWYKDPNTGTDTSASNGRSSVWHKGVGGGIWFTPFNLTVLSTEVARSVDGTMFYVRLGHLF